MAEPTKRTNASKVVDLDAEFGATLKAKKKYPTKLFGKTWTLIQPDVAELSQVEDERPVGERLGEQALAYVEESERKDFLAAWREAVKGKEYGPQEFANFIEMLDRRTSADVPQ